MDYTKAILQNMKNKNGRKLVFWGGGVLAEYLLDALEQLEIPVAYWIDGEGGALAERNNVEYIVSGIDDVPGGTQENFVFAAMYSGHKEVVEALQQRGYRYNVDFVITNITVYIKDIDMIDPLLAYSRSEEKIPGIVQFGDNGINRSYKVLILGNSTAETMVGGVICWPYFLQKKIEEKMQKNVIVYNGALSSYNSGQEFLKLARDGLELKPDIVISFGGVTDVQGFGSAVQGKGLLNTYQNRMWENIIATPNAIPDSLYMRNLRKVATGIETSKKDFEVWVGNERKMYALCREFGIKFVGCLQPMITHGGYIIEKEMLDLLMDAGFGKEYSLAQERFINGVKSKIAKYSYLRDLTDIYNGKEECYFDNYHYTEFGNRIVADVIADIILKEEGYNLSELVQTKSGC